jgi:hypothetical protein
MTQTLTFAVDAVVPERTVVFEHQGIPPDRRIAEETTALHTAALDLYKECANPVGLLQEISASDFKIVYLGEGRNAPRTPVGDIFGRADNLALFAVTLGERISHEIEVRFRSNDFALGCMLDSVASGAADKAAGMAERRFFEILAGRGQITPVSRALRYSPGYCGWDMSGQRRLFEFLRPERIGISLRDSCLMEPLKSVSGVVIVGPREIHSFGAPYSFCSRCEEHSCCERIRTLLAE